MNDPAFGEDAVRALATVESFTRGRDYLGRDADLGAARAWGSTFLIWVATGKVVVRAGVITSLIWLGNTIIAL